MLLNSDVKLPDQLKKYVLTPLVEFTNDLTYNSPQANRIMKIYFKGIIDEFN